MPTLRRLTAACLPLVLLAGLAPPAHARPAHAQPAYQRVLNGTFDQDKTPWWSSGNSPSRVENGRLCTEIPGGTTNPWDAMIGQNEIPLEADQPYALRFTATGKGAIQVSLRLNAPPGTGTLHKQVTLTEQPQTFEFTGLSTVASRHAQLSFQAGGTSTPYTLCLDDVSLTGGLIPPGGGWHYGSAIRVNQHAYPVDGRKQASIVDSATQPLPWQVKNAAGAVVASGRTRVQGADAASRDHVHLADFSALRTPGTGYTLVSGKEISEPFDLSARPYEQLRKDALQYFFHNRSGIPIETRHVGPAHARPAGHLDVAPNRGDTAVPCLPGTCAHTLDVRGGWYDAGDHGKYVVNGALAAWQLLDIYERDRSAQPDGLLNIPERDNGVPDVLDEARWQLEFLLRMQVPAGQPLAGMAHHKVHDLAWTGHPLLPHLDPQPRYLHPPSTAATLNLAAAAARCARIWTRWDPGFAQRCRQAADTAWQAARTHPDRFAPRESVGGGPYDDTTVTDEFAWAAAELHATTGKSEYLRHLGTGLTPAGFSWRDTGGLADLTILRHPLRFPLDRVLAAKKRLLTVADGYVRTQNSQGYPNPGEYVWGATSTTANNAVIIATAHELTGLPRYRDAAFGALDHLLGRNALNQSFVTGYGERDSRNQHHRHWANQLDPALPNPPAGSLAGGPNPGLQDPVAQQNLPGCAPAKCYLDDIGSYSTNEVAINWNSALAWITAYADSQSTARPHAAAANPIELTSGFHVNPNSAPATWARNNPGDSRAARIQSSIGARPIARWFGNEPDIGATVASYVGAAASQDKLPVLVAYNLPGRDACGGHSGGGAGSPAAYRTWISSLAAGIGDRPAVVVVEPDALGDFECMSEAAIQERVDMLGYATRMFREKAPSTFAYLDGGNAGWVPAATMAARLDRAGVRDVRGFAVNVSNYYRTAESASYANSVVAALGHPAKFVIDTSRNGNGPNGQWCNPQGRKLGVPAQTGGGAELLLWIKTPGNSDGQCGIAPTVPAGQFSPELAVRLIDGV